MKIHRGVQIILIAAIMSFLSGCHVGRYITWNTADIKDHLRFPAYNIPPSPSPYHFSVADSQLAPSIPDTMKDASRYSSFDELLEKNHTLSFIVIRNDSILYEKYFNGAGAETRMTGFSVAKSFVSALAGIAAGEGYFSTAQPVTDFLSGFRHKGFDKVTINNLLNMRSGIRFSETYYNPFGHAARFYYGRNLERYAYGLRVAKEPGTKYHYNSANPLILAMIIEKTTGKKFTDYFGEKLWSRIGTEYEASWNYDSRKHGMVKAFCCINASSRDFARFGRLYLNGGNWEGEQVIPADWVDHSMRIHNDSRDSEDYPYTYYWRVLENGRVFAKGILGQYIFLDPDKKIIIVRFGSKRGHVHWSKLIEAVADQY